MLVKLMMLPIPHRARQTQTAKFGHRRQKNTATENPPKNVAGHNPDFSAVEFDTVKFCTKAHVYSYSKGQDVNQKLVLF